MKLCKDCPTDITETCAGTKLCRPCNKARILARSRAQAQDRRCFQCEDKLVNPDRGTKYCVPCKVIIKAMSKQQQRRNVASQRNTRHTGGEKVAAKIARIVAADNSYDTEDRSGYC